ncbi:hypothetical protein AAHA92_13470 [Salvia divinorum]|uniref:Uncharacterized protein n=1 Tax=Salvia divinorum TaxID=28513 RepID=A0ABD1H8D2_SALDI
MRRRSTRSSSPAESPAVEFDFDLNAFADIASSLKKKCVTNGFSGASGSKRIQLSGYSPSPQRSLKNVNTIAVLEELASSNPDSCLLHKQTLQDSDSRKPAKKASESWMRLRKNVRSLLIEAMEAEYAEFIAEALATASRLKLVSYSFTRTLCKTTIPELAKSSEKSISSLKSRFGISSTEA